jgi:hypothetical protein
MSNSLANGRMLSAGSWVTAACFISSQAVLAYLRAIIVSGGTDDCLQIHLAAGVGALRDADALSNVSIWREKRPATSAQKDAISFEGNFLSRGLLVTMFDLLKISF